VWIEYAGFLFFRLDLSDLGVLLFEFSRSKARRFAYIIRRSRLQIANPLCSQIEGNVLQPVLVYLKCIFREPLPKRLYSLEISRGLWLVRFPGQVGVIDSRKKCVEDRARPVLFSVFQGPARLKSNNQTQYIKIHISSPMLMGCPDLSGGNQEFSYDS
jgi:hypothetical protein